MKERRGFNPKSCQHVHRRFAVVCCFVYFCVDQAGIRGRGFLTPVFLRGHFFFGRQQRGEMNIP